MSSVTESNLEKKFQNVSNTQDSIQSFSLWIIHHKSHCKKIIDVWMKMLQKTKVIHRLTLLYLANDVIQNSRRKGLSQFSQTFMEVLPEATLFLRDDKIKGSVERVFTIWETRNIFSSEFIDGLKTSLNNSETKTDATAKIIAEYKPESLTEKIRKSTKAALETSSKLSALNGSKLDAANSEVLRQFKDRSHGQQFSRDFEEATRCLEEYIAALTRESAERAESIQLLEQAIIYYSNQSGEARIVANAYKSFSARVTTQKKKIESLIALLPSPLPSPNADAPSPTNSDDELDLTAETGAPVPLAVDDAPSPEGSPEDLQLSPTPMKQQPTNHTEDPFFPEEISSKYSVEDHPKYSSDNSKLTPDHFKMSPSISSNKDMPVSSFLGTQGAGLMSSWLDTFNKPLKSNADRPKDSKLEDSLDSRLLNLIQSIPSSVPSALLATVGSETPIKDEWTSGQGTPVQDEDEQPENPLLKNLGQYNSPNQSQWPSALPPNTTQPEPTPPREEIIEPLQPPPKPRFACLGLLSSPVKLPSRSPTPTTPVPVAKVRIDPRLANTKGATKSILRSRREDINNELLDMDLGESDDEGDRAKKVKKEKTEVPEEGEGKADAKSQEAQYNKTDDDSVTKGITKEGHSEPPTVPVFDIVGRLAKQGNNSWRPADKLKALLAHTKRESNNNSLNEASHISRSRLDTDFRNDVDRPSEANVDSDLRIESRKVSHNSHMDVENVMEPRCGTDFKMGPQRDFQSEDNTESQKEQHSNSHLEQHKNVNPEHQILLASEPHTGSPHMNSTMESLDSCTKIQTESHTDSRSESQIDSRTESQLDSRIETCSDLQVDSRTDSRMNSADSQLNSADSQLKSQIEAHTDSRMNAQMDSQPDSRMNSQMDSYAGSRMNPHMDSHIESLSDSRMDFTRDEPHMDYTRDDDPHMNSGRNPHPNSSGESRIQTIHTIQSVRSDDWRPVQWEDSQQMGYNYRQQHQQPPPPHQQHFRHPHHNYQQQQFEERWPHDRRPYHEHPYPGQGYPPPMLGGPKRFPGPFNGRGGRGYFVPRY